MSAARPGRVVMISGANRGIGAAIARQTYGGGTGSLSFGRKIARRR